MYTIPTFSSCSCFKYEPSYSWLQRAMFTFQDNERERESQSSRNHSENQTVVKILTGIRRRSNPSQKFMIIILLKTQMGDENR